MCRVAAKENVALHSLVIVSKLLPFEMWLRLPRPSGSVSAESISSADKADQVLLSRTAREWIPFFKEPHFIVPSCFTEPRRRSSRSETDVARVFFSALSAASRTAAVNGEGSATQWPQSASRLASPPCFLTVTCVNTAPSRKHTRERARSRARGALM